MSSGEYRVVYGYTDGFLHGAWLYCLCQDFDSLIDLLHCFLQMKKAPAYIKQIGTPKEIWNRSPAISSASAEFKSTAHYAEQLLAMEDSEFDLWIPSVA